jgi:vacuolar protein sorting-associated protein 13A/C
LWYKDLISVTSSKKFSPLSIRNQTLTSIHYKFKESSEEQELQPTSQQSITSLHSNRLNTKKVVYDQVCLNIRIEDFNVSNLNILEEGIIPLTYSKQNDALLYQVEFNKGQRIITFGSNIILYNKSSLPLQVKVEDTVQSTSYLMTVPVSEHDSIPSEFIANGSIYFRPLKEDNKPQGNSWSSPKLDCASLQKKSTCISVMNLDQGEFNYNLRIDEQKILGVTVYSIYLYAPLVIENVYSAAIKYKLSRSHETSGIIKKGESLTTYSVDISKPVTIQIQVPDFFEWSDVISLNDVSNPPFVFHDEQKNTFNLFYDKGHLENTLHLTIYSKYWIINRTEFNLIYYQYKDIAAGQSTKLQQVRSLENYSSRDWFHLEDAIRPTIFNFSANKCSLQLENGGISKPISFSAIQEGEVMIKDPATQKQFYLGISVSIAPTKYRRTKLVTISPRYLLVNKSKEIIYYQQVGNDQRFTLDIDQVAPYHFIDKKSNKQISISMDLGNKWRWSGGFPLGNIGSFYVNLIKIATNEIYFMRVDISVDRGTIIVIFRPKSKEIAPYRVENMCKEPISFWQEDVEEIIHNLEPSKSVFYAFDEITKPHYIYIRNDEYQFKHHYSLDKIKKHSHNKLSVEVFPDGPTKVLRIQPTKESILDSTDKLSKSSKREETDKAYQTVSIIELDSIGLSIVDANPRELAFVYFEGLYATYTQSKYQTSLQVSLRTLQIDNQLYFTPYPTVLRPINTEVDVFRASIVKSNEYPTIEFYNYFSILVQELDINIDSSWLNEILKFSDFNGTSQFDKQSDDTLNTQFVTDWNDTSRIIYFEIIHINPLKLNVSYYSPERNLQNLSEQERGQIELFVGGIIDKIPNMENASIKLNSLLLEYPSGTQQEIVSRISSHYVTQAIRESYKILGSFEFLGNPINTVSNLGTGIKDFFYEPLHGILLGPEEFKKGLSKGAKSLLKGTVYGLFNASSKITQGISKGFATISLDQEYQIERSKKSAHKPDNIKDGFIEAGKDLGKGVFEGITGLITQPVKGVKQEGVLGLFKGVGRGIVGVGIKPTAGIFDAFSDITQGISNRMIKRNVHRIRFPRYVGKEKILESYSQDKAFRQLLTTVIKEGKYSKELASYHIILDKKLYLVTNVHLFCLNSENFNINWKLRFTRIASIQKKQTDILVKEGKVSKDVKLQESADESPVASSQLARLRGADKSHTIRTNDEQLANQVFTVLNEIWSSQVTIETTTPSEKSKFISIFHRKEEPAKHGGTPPDEEKKKGGLLSRLRRKQHD